jgi:enamine deaminase RidA (YjgF/YER057c/UK114 family)
VEESMQLISSGSPWEAELGYSRATIAGGFVFISATAATGPDGAVIGRNDPYRQTQIILEKLANVLEQAGSTLDQVVQTRIYLTDISRWREVGRAHGEVFGSSRPAMSLLHVKPFLDPEMLVEIELIASTAA